jgi:hypothetical protein
MFPLLSIYPQSICVARYATHAATLSFVVSIGFRVGEILVLYTSQTCRIPRLTTLRLLHGENKFAIN